MYRKRHRVRINLTVDKEIWDLVQKWSYVSQIPVSRLFDMVMWKHVFPFKYPSEEEWEKSLEYDMVHDGEELPIDAEKDPDEVTVTVQDLLDAGIRFKRLSTADKKRDVKEFDQDWWEKQGISEDSFPQEVLTKLMTRALRGEEYYRRWEEVGGYGKKIPDK